MMRITILFGGTNKERLVSVASAQALYRALPEADLWFWDVADTVHEVASQKLLSHTRPFEDEFKPGNRGLPLEAALDKAKSEDRVLVLGLHGGRAENGELQAMCELRGIPFTGSGSASSNLAFDKVAAKRFAAIAGVAAPADVTLEKLADGFAITKVHLTLRAKIPGTDNAKFQELAAKAKAGCPVSKLLKADISLDASLV